MAADLAAQLVDEDEAESVAITWQAATPIGRQLTRRCSSKMKPLAGSNREAAPIKHLRITAMQTIRRFVAAKGEDNSA